MIMSVDQFSPRLGLLLLSTVVGPISRVFLSSSSPSSPCAPPSSSSSIWYPCTPHVFPRPWFLKPCRQRYIPYSALIKLGFPLER
ncbi:hypothetical protein F5Y14DRAFT_407838 [Nemania sp. NC0429]|nr:hypothetical protein F5Y14DRAFT_407838 [Nemania sp. NC0429]